MEQQYLIHDLENRLGGFKFLKIKLNYFKNTILALN